MSFEMWPVGFVRWVVVVACVFDVSLRCVVSETIRCFDGRWSSLAAH